MKKTMVALLTVGLLLGLVSCKFADFGILDAPLLAASVAGPVAAESEGPAVVEQPSAPVVHLLKRLLTTQSS